MASHGTEPLPVAPYSPDLLADLHAGVLDESVSEKLWPLVRQDPKAMEVISALDALSARLGSLGSDFDSGEPMPPDVAERIDRALTTEQESSFGGRPGRYSRRWAYTGIGIAAAVAIVASLSALLLLRPSGPTDPDTVAAPAYPPSLVLDSSGLNFADVRDLLGRQDPTELKDAGNLPECLAANGFDPQAILLAATPVQVDGRSATLLVMPRFPMNGMTVLVVGSDCGEGNPQTLVRRDLN